MDNNLQRIWQGFWQLADPKIWIASTVPIFVGAAMAYNLYGHFNLYWFIWTLIGIYMIEIGKNAINEFVDYKSGVDKYVKNIERTPFSGGKKTIVDGKLTLNETKYIAFITMFFGAVIGLYISFSHEPGIFFIGIFGFILSIVYSLPPFKLAYRGLGELTVGLTFGPLIVCGSFLVQAHMITIPVILASLPIGLLIANILWINQYPDYSADKKGQKLNWVVRLGKKQGIKVYITLFALNYLSILILVIIFNSLIWLLPFISLPLVFKAVKTAKNNYNNIPKLIGANLKTVQVYQLIGVTMVMAAILDRFI